MGGAGGADGEDPNNTTVFVGGIDATITEEVLRESFTSFGEVRRTCLNEDRLSTGLFSGLLPSSATFGRQRTWRQLRTVLLTHAVSHRGVDVDPDRVRQDPAGPWLWLRAVRPAVVGGNCYRQDAGGGHQGVQGGSSEQGAHISPTNITPRGLGS